MSEVELKNKKKMKAEFDKLSPMAKGLLLETLREMRKPEKVKEICEGLERGKTIILGLKNELTKFK